MNVRLKLGLGRVAFVAGLGSTVAQLIFGSSAFAQEPTPTPFEAEVEPVIVTGSYIPTQTAAEVGANPVQVIDRYTIEKSGERNTEELLRNLPVANANGVPTSGNAGNTSGQGASSISLRGFDPGATQGLLAGLAS